MATSAGGLRDTNRGQTTITANEKPALTGPGRFGEGFSIEPGTPLPVPSHHLSRRAYKSSASKRVDNSALFLVFIYPNG